MERIREAQVGPLADVAEDVRPVLRACLARKPEERVASAEALRRMLSPLRRVRPEGGPSELAHWVREDLGQGPTGDAPGETVLEEP